MGKPDELRQDKARQYGAGEKWKLIDRAAAQRSLEQQNGAEEAEYNQQRPDHGSGLSSGSPLGPFIVRMLASPEQRANSVIRLHAKGVGSANVTSWFKVGLGHGLDYAQSLCIRPLCCIAAAVSISWTNVPARGVAK